VFKVNGNVAAAGFNEKISGLVYREHIGLMKFCFIA
jgi:hypothetical protein